MKSQYSKFLKIISAILLFLVPANGSWGCAPILETDETMFLLFQRDLPAMPNLSAFYYTQRLAGTDTDPEETDYHQNCEEWKQFTKNKATEKDIYTVLYAAPGTQFISAYNAGKWDSFTNNTFINWLQKPKNKQSLQYLVYAKQIEKLQTTHIGNTDPWDVKPADAHKTYDSLSNIGLQKCPTHIPDFLKQRYAYQTVKLMYYLQFYFVSDSIADHIAKDNTPLITCYNTYLKDKNTIVAAWGALFYGLSFADRNTRTTELIKAFDKSNQKKNFIYNHLSAADVKAIIPLTQDPNLLAACYAYIAIKNPGRGLDELKQIYHISPQSPYIKLLVAREVNKLEDWILSPTALGFYSPLRESMQQSNSDTSYTYFAATNLAKDKAYLAEVCSFLITNINTSGQNQDFLKLAIIHLYHIDNNFEAAQKYINTLPSFTDKILETQCQIEKTINLIYTQDITQPATQATLYTQFMALQQLGLKNSYKKPDSYETIIPYGIIMQELYLLLSNQFHNKGDNQIACLLFNKIEFRVNNYHGYSNDDNGFNYHEISYLDKYGTVAGIDSFLAFKHKTTKTDFEKMLEPTNWMDDNIYEDLKGTLLLRQGKFKEAQTAFAKLPDDFWEKHYEFATFLRKTSITSLGTLLPVKTGNGKNYTQVSKKEMLNDIIALQDSLNTTKIDTQKAAICFLLANCYYNISYYGKDWMLYSYGWSVNEESNFYNNNDDYNWCGYSFYPNSIKYCKIYYECSWAIEMYKKALLYSKNQELSAQCTMMLGRCDRQVTDWKKQTAKTKTGIYHSETSSPSPSIYFALLKNKYSNTNTYQLSKIKCPDVR